VNGARLPSSISALVGNTVSVVEVLRSLQGVAAKAGHHPNTWALYFRLCEALGHGWVPFHATEALAAGGSWAAYERWHKQVMSAVSRDEALRSEAEGEPVVPMRRPPVLGTPLVHRTASGRTAWAVTPYGDLVEVTMRPGAPGAAGGTCYVVAAVAAREGAPMHFLAVVSEELPQESTAPLLPGVGGARDVSETKLALAGRCLRAVHLDGTWRLALDRGRPAEQLAWSRHLATTGQSESLSRQIKAWRAAGEEQRERAEVDAVLTQMLGRQIPRVSR